jgi:hypothetical protein
MGGVRGVFLRWSPADCIKAADYTLERFRSLGAKVETPNRIERARDLVRQANLFNVQYDRRDRTTEFGVAEAQRTIFETFLIVKDLQPPSAETRKKLRSILRAPEVPVLDGDDPGRDAQAELFTGAIFRAAGFHVDVGEPDLRIRSGIRVWGVAVKRVKSDRQFSKRVRKAQQQLAGQGLYGFIVVNPEIFLARAYAQDSAADLSVILFDKTGDWVNYLEQDQTLDRVLAVVGLATSFRLVRSPKQAFEFGLHIHYRFVTKGEPAELAAIRAMSETMMASLKESFDRIRIPE